LQLKGFALISTAIRCEPKVVNGRRLRNSHEGRITLLRHFDVSIPFLLKTNPTSNCDDESKIQLTL